MDLTLKGEELAMTVLEATLPLQGDARSAGVIPMTKKNVILHVNNWGILGGIESLVIDIAKAFPQFFHILMPLQGGSEKQDFIRYCQNHNVRYMNACGKLTKALVEEISPAIIFLHNTQGAYIEGKWPYEWLKKYRVVGVHHAVTWPLVPADLDWFVSNWVRRKYKKCKMNAITLPPCVDPEPYLKIKRPFRKRAVIGRIQSQTRTGIKVTDHFYDILNKVRKGKFFIVTANNKTSNDKYTFAPIMPGCMSKYLAEVDVFAIWGGYHESWSRVVTEANLSGIPVVARNLDDGLAEQLRASGGGFLVNSEDEFVRQLEELTTLPDSTSMRRTVGIIGREWCLKNASLEALRMRLTPYLLEWSVF